MERRQRVSHGWSGAVPCRRCATRVRLECSRLHRRPDGRWYLHCEACRFDFPVRRADAHFADTPPAAISAAVAPPAVSALDPPAAPGAPLAGLDEVIARAVRDAMAPVLAEHDVDVVDALAVDGAPGADPDVIVEAAEPASAPVIAEPVAVERVRVAGPYGPRHAAGAPTGNVVAVPAGYAVRVFAHRHAAALWVGAIGAGAGLLVALRA